MAASLKAAVLDGESRPVRRGLPDYFSRAAILNYFPALVQAAENPQHGCAPLCSPRSAHGRSALSRAGASKQNGLSKQRRDPTFVRRNVLAALEGSLARFAKHERQELIDAYLLLAPCDHSPMLRMLNERQHPCHSPIVGIVGTEHGRRNCRKTRGDIA